MAGEIAQAFVRIRPETSAFKSETKEGVLGAVRDIAKGAAAIFAAEKIFDFGKEAVSGAAQLQKSGEVITSAFGKASDSVKSFNEGPAVKLGISAAAGEQVASKFGLLFSNMKIGNEKSAEMTVGFEKLAGSLSLIRGQDPSLVLDKLTMAAAGNTRGLKQLGIVIDQHQIKTEALKLGLIKTTKDAIDPATKAQAIYALATQNLTKFQDEAAKHSGDLKDRMVVMKAEFANLTDQVGMALLPVFSALTTVLANVLPPVINVVKVGVKALADEMKKVADAIKPIASALLDFAKKNQDILLPLAAVIGGIVVAYKLWTIATAAWTAITEVATAAQEAFNAVMAMNPIGLLVLAIAGLVVGLFVLYQRSEETRRIVNAAFTDIKRVVGDVVGFLEELWDKWGAKITEIAKTQLNLVLSYFKDVFKVIGDIVQMFSDLFHGRWSKLWDDAKKLVVDGFNAIVASFNVFLGQFLHYGTELGMAILNGLANGLANLASWIVDKIKAFGESIPELILWVLDEGLKIGKAIIQGIINGIEGIGSGIFSAMKNTVKGAIDAIKGWLGINSPSKLSADEIGAPIGEGVVHGFLLGVGNLPAKMKQSIVDALNQARNVVQGLQGTLGNAFSQLGSRAMQAFDAATQARLSQMQSTFNAKVQAAVIDPMNRALAFVQRQNDQAMKALDTEQGQLTTSEQKLKTLQDQTAEMQRQQALTDAQAAKASDLASGTATADTLTNDQRAIDAATLAIQEADLQTQANIERAALDKKVADARNTQQTLYQQQQDAIKKAADAQTGFLQSEYDNQVLNYQSERDLQASHLQTWLDQANSYLQQHPAQWQTVHDEVMKLFNNVFGPDYKTAAQRLGIGFATGLRESFPAIQSVVDDINRILTAKNPITAAGTGVLTLPSYTSSSGTVGSEQPMTEGTGKKLVKAVEKQTSVISENGKRSVATPVVTVMPSTNINLVAADALR